MSRTFGLFAVLAVMWWFWSGYTYSLLIAFGIGSCLLVTWLSQRMQLLDDESHYLKQMPRIMFYWCWLLVEISKSCFDVSRRIITGNISPAIKKLPVTQKTDQGRVTYANSITLTPGTLSFELESDDVHVHALHAKSLVDLEKGMMASKVNKTEDDH